MTDDAIAGKAIAKLLKLAEELAEGNTIRGGRMLLLAAATVRRDEHEFLADAKQAFRISETVRKAYRRPH